VAIEPDTKDWTWVLARRCPECGYDARAVTAADVPDRVASNAAAWQDVLARPDVASRSRPDRWSALEYACHVRDVCTLYLERLVLMRTEVGPLFQNWDQDATAIEHRYDRAQPAAVAAELASASDALVRGLRAVGAGEWARVGRRSDGAVFTIESFTRYLLHDLVHHLWDVGVDPSGP
jgi:hypothetical protein